MLRFVGRPPSAVVDGMGRECVEASVVQARRADSVATFSVAGPEHRLTGAHPNALEHGPNDPPCPQADRQADDERDGTDDQRDQEREEQIPLRPHDRADPEDRGDESSRSEHGQPDHAGRPSAGPLESPDEVLQNRSRIGLVVTIDGQRGDGERPTTDADDLADARPPAVVVEVHDRPNRAEGGAPASAAESEYRHVGKCAARLAREACLRVAPWEREPRRVDAQRSALVDHPVKDLVVADGPRLAQRPPRGGARRPYEAVVHLLARVWAAVHRRPARRQEPDAEDSAMPHRSSQRHLAVPPRNGLEHGRAHRRGDQDVSAVLGRHAVEQLEQGSECPLALDFDVPARAAQLVIRQQRGQRHRVGEALLRLLSHGDRPADDRVVRDQLIAAQHCVNLEPAEPRPMGGLECGERARRTTVRPRCRCGS